MSEKCTSNEVLLAYFLNLLPRSAAEAVEAHAATCKGCGKRYDQMLEDHDVPHYCLTDDEASAIALSPRDRFKSFREALAESDCGECKSKLAHLDAATGSL